MFQGLPLPVLVGLLLLEITAILLAMYLLLALVCKLHHWLHGPKNK
ncbi:MAG: hypothetical protein E7K47_12190 [Acidovorax sp.]|nr:hypothetical protein [Acidovorax sp.]